MVPEIHILQPQALRTCLHSVGCLGVSRTSVNRDVNTQALTKSLLYFSLAIPGKMLGGLYGRRRPSDRLLKRTRRVPVCPGVPYNSGA